MLVLLLLLKYTPFMFWNSSGVCSLQAVKASAESVPMTMFLMIAVFIVFIIYVR